MAPTKTRCLVPILAAAMLIPIGIGVQATQGQDAQQIPASSDGTEADHIALYDSWFPESNAPDHIKLAMVDQVLNAEPVPLPIPDNQEEMAKRALGIIEERDAATDPEIREQKQRELDLLTIPMLRAGLVLMEKWEEDPETWGRLLDAFSEKENATHTAWTTYTTPASNETAN